MKKNKILDKIKSGEVRMKPKWEFGVVKSGKITAWLISIAITAIAVLAIIYFIKIYNPTELSEFGDLGWQIFYEDFPYYWSGGASISLAIGILIMINTGKNYKRSWQKNLLIMSVIILGLTIGALFLGL